MFQIIWTCSTIFNSINARRIEFTIKLQREANHIISTLDSISKGNNLSLDVINQNKLRDTVTHDVIDRSLSINNHRQRLMPKITIKHKSNVSYPKNSSYAPTTRRPLMKIMKFTTKPHVIHYIHSRFQDEQRTISIPKNSNIKIQFKPRNNKANQNITEDTDSVDDKFKTFIDVGDTDKQRDNFFATAASEKVGSVTNHSKFNTDEFRSYSKRAFEESLENIRNIRSRKNTTKHSSQKNTEPVPTQITNNIIYIVVPSKIKNPAEILTASEQLALVTKLTEEPINPAQLKGNVFNVVNLTETLNTYVNTTEKSHFTKEDKSLATRIEQAIFPAIRDTDDNAPTSQELIVNKPEKNIIGIQIITEKNNEYQAQSDKLEDSKIVTNSSFTIQQPDDQTKAPVNVMLNVNVVTTENTAVFTNTKKNIDNLKNMNKVVGTENTTENINNSLINETSVNFVTDTEKLDDPVVKTDAPVNHNNVVQIEKENTNFPTPKNTNDFATNSETFAVTGTKTEDINSFLINAKTTIHTSTETVTTIALTQPFDGPVVTTEKLVNYANSLETTTLSTSTKENIIDFATKSKNFAVFETTTENIQNSLKNTYTSNYSVATTEKILSSDVETNTQVTHPDDMNIAKFYKTENFGASETTTINTEKFSHLVTNKPVNSTHKSKKTLYHAEIVSTWPFRTADIIAAVETSGKTVLKTEKTVPLVVIVAGNSISLPELNEANGKIVDPDISTIKDEDKVIKEDKFSESPISVEDEASITMAHHLALRRKR